MVGATYDADLDVFESRFATKLPALAFIALIDLTASISGWNLSS